MYRQRRCSLVYRQLGARLKPWRIESSAKRMSWPILHVCEAIHLTPYLLLLPPSGQKLIMTNPIDCVKFDKLPLDLKKLYRRIKWWRPERPSKVILPKFTPCTGLPIEDISSLLHKTESSSSGTHTPPTKFMLYLFAHHGSWLVLTHLVETLLLVVV